MRFVITARASAREVSFQRNSMLDALEQALMLASSGMTGVRIVDSRGRSHSPAELSRTLLEAGARETGKPAANPLAA